MSPCECDRQRGTRLYAAIMVYFVVYVSSSPTRWSLRDLDELLAQSRLKNDRLGISGMLLYKGGNWMQALEGAESTVREVFTEIAADPRHKGILMLIDGHQETRQFPGWSMAFRDLDGARASAIPGYSNFMDIELTSSEFAADPTLCQKLLTTFKNLR